MLMIYERHYLSNNPDNRQHIVDRQLPVSDLNQQLLRFKQQVFVEHKWLEQFTNRQTLLPERSYLLIKRPLFKHFQLHATKKLTFYRFRDSRICKNCFESNYFPMDFNRFSAILKLVYSIELYIIFNQYLIKN
jgi:hypothetical protein